jgi:hypothetical protein
LLQSSERPLEAVETWRFWTVEKRNIGLTKPEETWDKLVQMMEQSGPNPDGKKSTE